MANEVPTAPMHTLQQAVMTSDPTLPMNIATKQYVDNAIAQALGTPPPPTYTAIGVLAQPMDDQYDTVVALQDAPTTAVTDGATVKIDYELMTVLDATDQNNLQVTRGDGATAGQAHVAGAVVLIAS